ncbi:Tail Collar domain protein [Ruminiclostridium papyrosolvens DSM 2782]|uniref:Tail Collar domain protein n=1 Tax=Ruminiclostridium papyrosolvens DSM 2782 TaxID=588581 RepID=F1TGA2_9FIRM|nr:tail fiber protein [Ruminiclostridium papyrosolvens]EGD46467.1 Tail Collar domain protein [Ruminiclostridium papyrosolvens DSM 2782]WES35198.1 tail fiber protein [Ruminiclostridium papyrosolvens DSM 2782]
METMLGEIELFPFTFVPRGWLLCNGQLLSIAQNQALYSLLRNSYGGDGRTTFALPNLLGTEPIPNTKFYIAIQGFYPTQG